ncbi:MAG: enoyl-CoA hydratase/isomerase family protein [Gammaproteobacteria bacterium]
MSAAVVVHKHDGITKITLNRPAVLNALNPDMAQSLHGTLRQVAADDETRCVIIAGAGDHFMAGGDVAFFRDSLERIAEQGDAAFGPLFDHVHGAVAELRSMDKPVIASVRGAAAGFGVSLVAASDLAVAADNAVFTLAYCHIGTSPDGASTYYLPRMVGLKRAMELVLLGDRFDAKRALSMGLVNEIVPAAELDAATEKLATRLARGPRFAYARTKALINRSLHAEFMDQLDAEERHFKECAQTADFAEGVRAFCEKRKPEFD